MTCVNHGVICVNGSHNERGSVGFFTGLRTKDNLEQHSDKLRSFK